MEKRKHKRTLLASYLDTYEMDSHNVIGYLADISHGGMMLISKNPIQVNKAMSLHVNLPDESNNNKELKLVARSIRCIKDSDFNYFNTGFEIKDLSSRDIETIDHLVARHEL
ncbi:MAG: PilZ domain-containing protein [Proteobacteria bacterium]|nr:PilZ domain-containing protein [Pseudomonadota bacterium]